MIRDSRRLLLALTERQLPRRQVQRLRVKKDCRTTGCSAGNDCVVCWGGFAFVPHGAVC